MFIIADYRLPSEAKASLAKYGEVLSFDSGTITTPPLSGHPDIFLCEVDHTIIVSPNIPAEYKNILIQNKIPSVFGKQAITPDYPVCATYNAVATEKYLIHHLSITDDHILKIAAGKQKINVNQGFTRCSLLMFNKENFITSDGGIYKSLTEQGLDGLLVSPKDIILPGYAHGLFGGACTVRGQEILICGSLEYFKDGENVRHFITSRGYRITELYSGPLFDGGGIFFLA